MPAKVGTIFLVAVMSFAAIGAGYAHWQETLTISGVMTTDDINPIFAELYSNDDPDSEFSERLDPTDCGSWEDLTWIGDRRDKDVGNTDVYTTEDEQVLNIEINDAYPCYYSHILYHIRNTGSCPVLIHRPLMLEELSIQTDPEDPSTHQIIDIDDISLIVDTWYFVKINDLDGTAILTIDNGGHPENFDFSIKLTGSNKINLIDFQLDPYDWANDEINTVSSHMQNPDEYCDEVACDLCIHFENDCMEKTIYDFKFGLNFYNWPEYTNKAPVAITGGPYTAYYGLSNSIDLDGSASYDPDGTIVLYEWDFDGDGTYDWSSASTGIATHVYSGLSIGSYNIALRVTDNLGRSTSSNDILTVVDFQDDFNDNSIDANRWTIDYAGADNWVKETNSEAEFQIYGHQGWNKGHAVLWSNILNYPTWNTIKVSGKWKTPDLHTGEMRLSLWNGAQTKRVGVYYAGWWGGLNPHIRFYDGVNPSLNILRAFPSDYVDFELIVTKTSMQYWEDGVKVQELPTTVLSSYNDFKLLIGGWDYSPGSQHLFYDDISIVVT